MFTSVSNWLFSDFSQMITTELDIFGEAFAYMVGP